MPVLLKLGAGSLLKNKEEEGKEKEREREKKNQTRKERRKKKDSWTCLSPSEMKQSRHCAPRQPCQKLKASEFVATESSF